MKTIIIWIILYIFYFIIIIFGKTEKMRETPKDFTTSYYLETNNNTRVNSPGHSKNVKYDNYSYILSL